MGSSGSRLLGCFSRPRNNSSDGFMGVQFSEPLDEGLGHSFCYVRPQPYSSPPLVTPDRSEELAPLHNSGKHGPVATGADESGVDGSFHFVSSKDEKDNGLNGQGKVSIMDRPRLSCEKPKNGINDKMKFVSETSFKAISGASVSANTATPRSIISCEQFNSFSNVLYDRAAAFESTSSFSAIPLQPVPRGFSGPLSGPLDRGDRGFLSGPLERERGFMSGPLERGFMSGPLERGSISGPLDCSADRSHFSAPLASSYHDSGYFRKRKKSLVQFVTSMSGPLKKAFARTASSLAKTHKAFVSPVRNSISGRDGGKEVNRGAVEKEAVDSVDPASVEFLSAELEVRGSDNLQWAQGKAGEDRVHVVISEEQGWIFVGIYDGFNGPDAPDFLMSNLYPAVSQELQGLLWDPKEEPSLPGGDGEQVNEPTKEEIVGSSLVDGREQASDCWGKQRAGANVTQTGQRENVQVGGLDESQKLTGIRNGQDMNGENSSIHLEEPSEKIIPRSSLDDSGHPESINGTCELEDEAQIYCGACSDPDASQDWGGLPIPLAEGGTHVFSGQEEKHPNIVKLGSVETPELFANESEGKLAEDWGNGQVNEIEDERSSDLPELSETSAVPDQDHNRKTKRQTAGRLRHGHDRRKEQLRKYFQWRYDWDEEQSGVVQKVKNAKIAQEPDSPSNGKAVEHASVLKALARALENTENAYLDMADRVLYENPELALMGSCVLVMLMKDEDMYILNVGDSRAILAQHPKKEPVTTVLGNGGWNALHGNDSGARDSLLKLELGRIIEETPMELEALESSLENGSVRASLPSEPSLLGALQLTTDHSTNIKEEVSRLRAEHPDDDTIENDRVKGKLKVTRAFGAGFLKQPKWNSALLEMFQINFIGNSPYITCSPALYHHRLGPQDEFLVLSSDGLYQYFSNEEVVSHVEWFMKSFPDGDPAQHLIEELLFRAAKKAGMDFHELLDIPQGDRRKYHDDVSVMVISLEGRIWRSSG